MKPHDGIILCVSGRVNGGIICGLLADGNKLPRRAGIFLMEKFVFLFSHGQNIGLFANGKITQVRDLTKSKEHDSMSLQCLMLRR